MKFVYTLRPKAGLEPVLDMFVESRAVLGLLEDERFPDSKSSIISYSIDIKRKEMKITLNNGMYKDIYNSLVRVWEIEKDYHASDSKKPDRREHPIWRGCSHVEGI